MRLMPLPVQALDELRRLLAEAAGSGDPEPTAMNLSTIDARGRPHSRIVLLKGVAEDGLRFFTNYRSAKAEELAANALVALCLHWKQLREGVQVRVEGLVQQLPAGGAPGDQLMPVEIVERGDSGRTRHWMMGEGLCMQQRARSPRQHVGNAPGGEHRGERHVSAGDALAQRHDVGRGAVGFERGPGSGSARTRQDFVRDPEHLVPVADFPHPLPIIPVGERCAGGRPLAAPVHQHGPGGHAARR